MHFVEPHFPPHPQCYRSVCAACGVSRTGEKVLNTGIEADLGENGFYAVMYLCASCVCEWGREFGQLDPEKSGELRSALADANEHVEFLREQLAAYEDLDRLVKAHANRFAIEPPVDAAPEPEPAPQPERAKPGPKPKTAK